MNENEEIAKIWEDVSEEARELLSKVLQIEHEKLSLEKPEGIAGDIVSAVEGIVK